jgi:hypothetical protein
MLLRQQWRQSKDFRFASDPIKDLFWGLCDMRNYTLNYWHTVAAGLHFQTRPGWLGCAGVQRAALGQFHRLWTHRSTKVLIPDPKPITDCGRQQGKQQAASSAGSFIPFWVGVLSLA